MTLKESRPLIRFTLGGRRFALELPLVSEMTDLPLLHPVPGAPPCVAGVADIRGRVVTLLDLAALFRLPIEPGHPRSPSGRPRPVALVLAGPHDHLAVLAGSDTDITHCAPGEIDAPENGPEGAGELVGREVLLEDGSPCTLIHVPSMLDACAARVRERYRVGG